MPRRSTSAVMVLAGVLLSCAGLRSIRPDERVIHVRELVSASPAGVVSVAELAAADDAPPTLRVLSAAPGGELQPVAEATPEEAAEALARFLAGAPLPQVLPASLASTQGVSGDRPPAPAPARPLPLVLGEPLRGWVLAARSARDDAGEVLVLELSDGRSEPAVELARVPAKGPTELAAHELSPLWAAVRVRWASGDARARASDVVVLDLGDAAGTLHEKHALEAYDREAWPEALVELDRAEQLAPRSATIPYNRACVLARAGRPAEALLPLAKAVELSPSLVRMYARTDPDLEPLRDDPAFLELTRPRPLPGTDRAGGSATAPRGSPSVAPGR